MLSYIALGLICLLIIGVVHWIAGPMDGDDYTP